MAQACKSESFIYPFVCRANQGRDIAPLTVAAMLQGGFRIVESPVLSSGRNDRSKPDKTARSFFSLVHWVLSSIRSERSAIEELQITVQA